MLAFAREVAGHGPEAVVSETVRALERNEITVPRSFLVRPDGTDGAFCLLQEPCHLQGLCVEDLCLDQPLSCAAEELVWRLIRRAPVCVR